MSIPSYTYDLTQLSLSGTHAITAKAKKTGYADSVASTRVSYTASGGGYSVTMSAGASYYSNSYIPDDLYKFVSYSLDGGTTWVDLGEGTTLPLVVQGASQIKFKLYSGDEDYSVGVVCNSLSLDANTYGETIYTQNYVLNNNVSDVLLWTIP